MNVNQMLRKAGLNPSCEIRVVQGVRELVEKQGRSGAARLIHELTGITAAIPTNEKKAIQFTQYVVSGLYNDNKIDRNVLIDQAMVRVERLANDPMNQWMYATKEVPGTIQQQVSKEVEITVAVKEDGTIKKGGRAVLAEELYNKYIINGTKQTSRAEMIDLFVKEIGMTPAGASTYFANAKAKLGDPKGLIVAAKKGRK